MATWFITGCSTGFGRLLAEAALDAGHNVVATARDPKTLEDLVASYADQALALRLDVTDRAQAAAAVAEAEARFGAIDVLVNNAGYGYRSAIEEGEDDAVERLFATHVFGPLALIKAVLPGMRARRSGTIMNISSIAARMAPAGSGYYAGVKAALEAITASLRKELAPLGIRAFVVEPGGFRTDFAGRSLTQSEVPIGDYAETAGLRRIEHDTAHGRQPGDPTKAAKVMLDIVDTAELPFVLVLGSDALGAFRASLEALQADADAWASISASTDFGS